MLTTTDPAGGTTAYTCDGVGSRLSATADAGDPVRPNQSTMRSYNSVGDVAAATEPNGDVTRYAYDAPDRPAAVTDPVGRATTFAYDAVGLRTGP